MADDEKSKGDSKLVVGGKTLSLKPRTETGVVRQSFNHGRTKQILVEKKPRFINRQKDIASDEPKKNLEEILGEALKTRDQSPKAKMPLRPILPLEAIPEQNLKKAIAFRPTGSGPLDLLADPSSDKYDPEQSELYVRIRAQLNRLKEEIPSQERNQINSVVDDFLAQPAFLHEVRFKKILWLCGNALRSVLAQHDAVKDSNDPHYSKLPPAVAESIRRPIQEWNVFVFGDDDLREMDDRRIGPQEQRTILANISAAKPIVETAAENREITTEHAAQVVETSIKSAELAGTDINAKQAQDVVEGTIKNLITQIIRRAHLFCSRLIDPRTDEDQAVLMEYKKGAAKTVGVATVTGVIGSATLAISHSAPYAVSFFEFVASNAGILKEYLVVAFQDNQVAQIVDTIEYTRKALRSSDQNE